MSVHELSRDTAAVAIPRAEIQLVVRWGPMARAGLDIHAVGARQQVHRKFIAAGHWSVTARLRLGAQEAVLGVPASALAGRIVALHDLWGDAATRGLLERLGEASDPGSAAQVLENAIAARLPATAKRQVHAQLALDAAERLVHDNVRTVALDLGVSDRHLRRVFHETVGVSPKAFARLLRFRRAVHAARQDTSTRWAAIAARAGYYDQAHLIAEFRTIAGVTPRALLGELEERSTRALIHGSATASHR